MSEIPAVLERILELSKADACIAIGERSSSANIRWANNTSTTNGVSEDGEIVIISVIGKRVGMVHRNYFPDASLEQLVRESEAACDGKPEAEDYMPLLEGSGRPDNWSAPAPATDIGIFADFTTGLAALFERARASGVKLFGYAEHNVTTTWLATSTGVLRRHSRPEGKVELTAKSDDFKRSAWAGQITSAFDDVDLDAMYRKLEQRLDWSKTSVDLPPGPYEVLLEPAAVADMILYQVTASSARDADEGRTVFSKPGGGNRIGDKIGADSVTIYSDPNEPGLEVTPFTVAAGSSSYASLFDNGLDAGKTPWIEDGVLRNLITTRSWAEQSSVPKPVPFVMNLIFPGDGPSLDAMIASTKRGLLVTCLWYIRTVDPQTLLLTGLTRDGVFLIENGEVRGAVNNFRYNMSPVAMLAQALEVGRSELTLPREFEFALTKFPPLRVRDWNMSSVSEAT